MLKNKVDSLEEVGEGPRGGEKKKKTKPNFLRRSKHANKWKMISLVFHKSSKRIVFPDSVGKPLLFSPA